MLPQEKTNRERARGFKRAWIQAKRFCLCCVFRMGKGEYTTREGADLMSEGAHETMQDHEERIHALEERIFALEEKERERDRLEWDKELALDDEPFVYEE